MVCMYAPSPDVHTLFASDGAKPLFHASHARQHAFVPARSAFPISPLNFRCDRLRADNGRHLLLSHVHFPFIHSFPAKQTNSVLPSYVGYLFSFRRFQGRYPSAYCQVSGPSLSLLVLPSAFRLSTGYPLVVSPLPARFPLLRNSATTLTTPCFFPVSSLLFPAPLPCRGSPAHFPLSPSLVPFFTAAELLRRCPSGFSPVVR